MCPEKYNPSHYPAALQSEGLKGFYLSLVKGQKNGLTVSILLNALQPVSTLYHGLLLMRGLLYHHGFLPVVRLPLSVISVGNITMGGTGKTPFIEMLAKLLIEGGKRVAILSRGYRATVRGGELANDEAIELRQRLPGVPILLGKDRVTSARVAIEKFNSQCLLLDDGFQHFRLARDLDIVVIDSLSPFGNGRLLPAGMLREPLSGLRRAGLLVLSRTNLCTREELQNLKAKLAEMAPSIPIIETVNNPLYLEDTEGGRKETRWLCGRKVFAFCGLGNPASFEKTLLLLGADLVGFKCFPDHHDYNPEEEKSLVAEAQGQGVEALVTTVKDKVKLGIMDWPIPLFSLRIETRVTHGEQALTEALRKVIV